jgi:hypothetical protein
MRLYGVGQFVYAACIDRRYLDSVFLLEDENENEPPVGLY